MQFLGHHPINQPSLDILVRKIEAIPIEHWAELLTQLRQFREHVAQQPANKVSYH
jgi:hypothetical protein